MPLFDRASDVTIVAAFVQEGGVRRIEGALRRSLARGARVRLVTGDYLEITQALALEQLLDWQEASAARTAHELEDDESVPAWSGTFEARVVETSTLPLHTRSFHPKSWRFEGPGFGVAFVGSSNLSHSALETAIEWNLRVDREHDARAYDRVAEAFETLWTRARPLDAAWIEAYAERARRCSSQRTNGKSVASMPSIQSVPRSNRRVAVVTVPAVAMSVPSAAPRPRRIFGEAGLARTDSGLSRTPVWVRRASLRFDQGFFTRLFPSDERPPALAVGVLRPMASRDVRKRAAGSHAAARPA